MVEVLLILLVEEVEEGCDKWDEKPNPLKGCLGMVSDEVKLLRVVSKCP